MITQKKSVLTGLGTILITGAAFVAWKKSRAQRAKFTDWKKRKIENAYYNNLDERDIAYG